MINEKKVIQGMRSCMLEGYKEPYLTIDIPTKKEYKKLKKY